MTNDEILQRFMYLHRSRTDAWGAVHGESVQTELTADTWRNHLWGDGSVGIYPLQPAGDGRLVVAWGCTDIDSGYERSLPLARNIVKTLKLLGVTAWCERTKGKGFHVWIYVAGYVPADTMRNTLLVAHQVAGVAATEVNPKQTTVAGLKKGLGNYVNAPYAKTWTAEDKRVVLDPDTGQPMALEQFVTAAHGSLNTPETLSKAASRYVPPPPPPTVAVDGYSDVELEPLVKKLPGLAFTIFQNGVLDGRDRSGTLARLAHLCAEAGCFKPSEAFALVVDADRRWGKFFDRADGMEQLQMMVARAFGKAQQSR